MTRRAEGKVSLVTGGASGIGKSCASRLVQEGARVVICDVDDEAGVKLSQLLSEAGGDACYLHLDVTSEDGWRVVVSELEKSYGRLDVLVNNAGLGISSPSIAEFSLELWRRQQSVNVEGVFLGVKYCLPLMRKGGGGSIINMSSVAGLQGSATMSSYCATKGAVRLFTKAIALECAARKDGIRVNSVHPGLIETPIWTTISETNISDGEERARSYALSNMHAVAATAVPLGMMGQPEDVAACVLFLASDETRYMTGAELVIDGGLTAR